GILAVGCGGGPTSPERHGPYNLSLDCDVSASSAPFTTCHAHSFCSLYTCAPGTPDDATMVSSWSSDPPGVVKIGLPGLLEAIAVGVTVVTAEAVSYGRRTR